MAARIKVSQIKPNPISELRATNIILKGNEFQSGATVAVAGLAPAVTYVSVNELRFQLVNTVVAGDYDLRVTNPDGGISNVITLTLEPITSAVGRYRHPEIDIRVQPLAAPFNNCSFSQRVIAGSQFDGLLPDVAQGKWLDVVGPTHGGRWTWAGHVYLRSVEFRTNGVEPGLGRTDGSGIYHRHADGGPDILVLELDGTAANAEYVYLEVNLHLKHGDELVVKTFGSTLEQIVIPVVEIAQLTMAVN